MLLIHTLHNVDLCLTVCMCWCLCVTMHVYLPLAEMNRHHYSLYVHNCRLVFLLRRDFTQVDTFRPAEFHWKLEQVSMCLVRVRVRAALFEWEHRFRVIF